MNSNSVCKHMLLSFFVRLICDTVVMICYDATLTLRDKVGVNKTKLFLGFNLFILLSTKYT